MIHKFILSFCLLVLKEIAGYSQSNLNSLDVSVESYKLNMGYVKSLSNKADFYFGSGDFEKAVEFGEERLKVLNALQEMDSLQYAIFQAELALFYSKVKKYNNAISIALDAIQILDKFNGQVSELAKIETEDRLSNYYGLIGDYEKSLFWARKVMDANCNLYGIDDEKYINSKERVASILSRMSNDEESIKIQEEILEYRSKHGDSLSYAVTLHDLSWAYAKNGNYEKAIKQCKDASAIFRKCLGETDEIYWQSLINLSDYYTDTGDFKRAKEVCEEYMAICLNAFGPYSVEYAKSLSVYAFNSYQCGDYLKAIDLQKRELEIMNCNAAKTDMDYAIALSNMALFNEKLGYVEDAIHNEEQALSILQNYPHTIAYREVNAHMSICYLLMGNIEKSWSRIQALLSTIDIDRDKDTYYKYLPYLANYYEQIYNDSCIALYEEILDYEKRKYGEYNVMYSVTLGNLSYAYRKFGKKRDAIHTGELSLMINRQLYGENSVPYAVSVSRLAGLYNMMGERERAISLNDDAKQIIKNVIGTDNAMYVGILRSHAQMFLHTPKEIKLLEEANDILIKLGENTTAYIENMCNLAIAYATQKDTIKMEEIINKLETQSKFLNYFDNNQKQYANFLSDVASCYISLGNYNEAIQYAYKSLEVSCRVYGKNDIKKHEGAIINLLVSYCATKEVNRAISLLKEYGVLNTLKKETIDNLQVLTSNYRYNYWKIFSPVFINLIPILAFVSKDDNIISQSYDMSALFAKSLLLKLETEVPDLIKLHGDSALQEDYRLYLSNIKDLDKTKSPHVRDSIMNVLDRQEDGVRQSLSNNGLFNNFNVSWTDVKNKLNDDDIAIEFITVTPDSVSKINAALLLKNCYSYPKFVALADAFKIKDFYLNGQSDSLYNNIWLPISDELNDVNNVYFSPSGEFHNIPIEYLPTEGGQYMHEQYNIFRLSSTQELLRSRQVNIVKDAVLFGGLNYDSNIPLVSKNEIVNIPFSPIDRGLLDTLSNRSGFDPLPNTKVEVSEISDILNQSKIQSVVYSGDEGSEESFKMLSGRSIDIIHLSTHGLFVKSFDKNEQRNLYHCLLNKDEAQEISIIERPLLRSFLVMSGGNRLPKHKYVPEGCEDGILTAQEISRLDLYGVDLVVLSACQTGLGDVDSEGVWGLQRGFKKAGVNTILMSLDKVDDEATRILMVEFYRNLMNGKTKRQSLKEAQQYLRKVDNGKYYNPKYWASFIMLDGLN